MQQFYNRFILEERLTVAMAAILNLLILVSGVMDRAWDIFCMNALIVSVILAVSGMHKHLKTPWMQYFRDWYVPAFLIFLYLENRRLVPLINPHDLDALFIRIDRFLFLGHDPTVLIEKITCPALSEFLQISYASFYFIPLTLALFVYFKKSRLDFHVITSTILMGFYLSYLGFYVTPVIGPRFTLEHVQSFSLTGIYAFGHVRDLLAQIEGIMRDCCPSGHTLISLLTMLLARKYFRPFFSIATVWASLVVFSAIYLRYHYVTDLIIGAALGLLVYKFGPMIAGILIREKDDLPGNLDVSPSS